MSGDEKQGEQLELGAAAQVKRGRGRPKTGLPQASERVIFRVTPAQLATLTAAARPRESAGEAARRLLLELLASGDIEGANP